MKLLIRKAHLVDPKNKVDEILDLEIENRKIIEIGKNLKSDGEIVEAEGLTLLPGLIDLHTHFREPGFEQKETIQTGAGAALRGGFVGCVSMPNTNPPCDHQSVIDNIIRKAKEVPFHLFPAGTISKVREGKELSEMADLKRAGIWAVTDDGDWVKDPLLMRRAMEYASMLGLLVISHCEDRRLSANGVMNEGLMSTQLGLKGIPDESEEVAVSRDIQLARLTGARLHVAHISTARSVQLIREAKVKGLLVTAEVTPHHLSLTEEAVEGYNTNFKMNPPLRNREDVEAIQQALKDGTIDCIATDHAPHTEEEKMLEFDEAPFGVIGLETALAVSLTELVHSGKLSLAELVVKMSTRPAEILHLPRGFGEIRKGTEAGFTLVDLNREWTVTPEELVSKSKNSCFIGRKLKGKVVSTLCMGKRWTY
ncbi:MAG: dihydroorotase [Omnitrophica WOR_2 bacterium RIFCSPLOWO2_12_FULL_51_8]|nr:MAG: dihydroorotase [Omnitrophica WOR_2 bacterium RIFCSPLOWO2_12_FULL_51_8]